jgi:hypothetical protein
VHPIEDAVLPESGSDRGLRLGVNKGIARTEQVSKNPMTLAVSLQFQHSRFGSRPSIEEGVPQSWTSQMVLQTVPELQGTLVESLAKQDLEPGIVSRDRGLDRKRNEPRGHECPIG